MAVCDGLTNALDDQVGRFVPAHVVEHHDCRQDQRPRINFVHTCVLGRCAVRGLEQGHVCADVGTRAEAQSADQGDCRI